jgi:hypothetical protein
MKTTLASTVGGYNLSTVDSNFAAIADEINNNTLSRNNPSGSPNSMGVNLDMNGFRIYNLPKPLSGNEPARLSDVTQAASGTPDWSVIINKPLVFPPTAHFHPTSDVSGLDSAIATLNTGKQDLLYSGTNIKTVNGYSLLGSGNISISGGGGGGDWNTLVNKPSTFPPSAHTHTTSEVVGLDTALAGKQSTLVSGTSIKTVNGVSLIGAGDVVTNTVATGGTGVTSITGLIKGNGTTAFSAAVSGTDYLTPSGVETVSNKRVITRVGSTTSSATPSINTDLVDVYKLTAQAVDVTSFTTNLTGTPTDNQFLVVEITGTAARAITWGASFEASTVALPTTTVSTSMLAVAFLWNTVTSKWRCVASV